MARRREDGLSQEEIDQLSQKEKLACPISDLGLSVRTTNTLEEEQIFTVRDLLGLTPERLRGFSNIGEKTQEEIFTGLERFGFFRDGKQPAPDVTAQVEERRRKFRAQYGIFD